MSSIGSTIGGLFGGGSGTSYTNPYTNTAQANTNATWAMNNANSVAQQTQPMYQSLLNSWNSDSGQLASNYQTAANQAATMYGTAASNAASNASALQGTIGNTLSSGQSTYNNMNSLAAQQAGLATSGMGAANSVLKTAMDPQSQLYAQSQQQATDQTNASLAARGLNTSALGAGVAAQANTNFNTNWQNNQLSRETTGLSAYNSALNSAESGLSSAGSMYSSADSALNNSVNTASNTASAVNTLGTDAAQNQLMSGALPYTTASSIYNTGLSNINAAAQDMAGSGSVAQQSYSDASNYMSGYNSSAQTASEIAKANSSMNSGLFGAIGGAIGGLTSDIFGSDTMNDISSQGLLSYAGNQLGYYGGSATNYANGWGDLGLSSSS